MKNGSTYTPKPGVQPQKFDGALPGDSINNGSAFGWIYGIASGQQSAVRSTEPVRYGDIGAVDLYALLKAGDPTLATLSRADFTDFSVSAASAVGLNIVRGLDAQGNVGGEIVSSAVAAKNKIASADNALFAKTGILYIAPDITADKLTQLRNGERIKEGETGSFTVTVTVQGKTSTYTVTIPFTDYGMVDANYDGQTDNVFFGDRPMHNPGYSKFELTGSVGVSGADNNPLDVWRVEQRLKYLGFPALRTGGTQPSQELTVDGSFGAQEQSALIGFYGMTHYTDWAYRTTPTLGYPHYSTLDEAKSVPLSANATETDNLSWLNAYNAPHLMNVYSALQLDSVVGSATADGRFTSGQDNLEAYTSSWTYDLMQAWRQTQNKLAANTTTLNSNSLRINGLTNPFLTANNGHGNGGHSINMTLDLGFRVDAVNGVGFISQNNINLSTDNNETDPEIGYVGTPYSKAFTVAGTAHTYAATGLPPGLTLNPTTGILAGSPTSTGRYTGTVTATATISNATNPVVSLPFDIHVSATAGWSVQNALDWSALLHSTTGYNQQGALRNFLSLYNLTISDGNKANGNGSWEELDVKNEGARNALFGGGTQTTSMIQHVFVGDKGGDVIRNSLPAIRKVVNALGIPVGPSDAHENHFHVDFRTPTRVAITPPPANLLAEGDVKSDASILGLSADDVVRLIKVAQAELNLEQGEMTMFAMDVPDVPQHYTSVMVAQANQAAANKERAIGVCSAVDYVSPELNTRGGTLGNYTLSPNFVAKAYFQLYEKTKVNVPPISNVEIVGLPKHGKIIYVKLADGLLYPVYKPDTGYVGDDKIVFRVNVDGKIVRVVELLKVTDKGADSLAAQDICKKTGDFWKISTTSDTNGKLIITSVDNQQA